MLRLLCGASWHASTSTISDTRRRASTGGNRSKQEWQTLPTEGASSVSVSSRQASFILTVQALRKRTESTSNLIQSIEDEQTRLEQVNAILVADEETEEYQIKVRGLIRVAM